MNRLSLAPLALALFLVGCSNDSNADEEVTRPTLISVDPAEFTTCEVTDPTWDQKRYVSTLCDVSAEAQGVSPVAFALPSSPPAACYQPITFSYVAPGRRYIARIDEYDGNLVEAVVPGERFVKRAGTGPVEILEPTRTFICNQSVLALNTLTRDVRGCTPTLATPTGSPPRTIVTVNVGNVEGLVPPTCRQAATYKIIGSGLDRDTQPSKVELEVSANQTCVNLSVHGYAAGQQSPLWTAHCYSVALEITQSRPPATSRAAPLQTDPWLNPLDGCSIERLAWRAITVRAQ